MRIFIFIAAALYLPLVLGAKENKDLMKANYYYYHYAYNEAIPYLEKLTDTGASSDLLEKLGDCYRLTGNTEKASETYEKAIVIEGHSDQSVLKCGLMQMRLGKYPEAGKQFAIYKERHPEDNRLTNLIQSCLEAPGKKEGFPTGVTQFAPFNSDGSDYAPTMWGRNLVFTSDSLFGIKKKTDKWSGNAYYGIYMVPLEGGDVFGEDVRPIDGPKEMNIKYHTGPCTFSADGTKMYFTRSRFNSGLLQNKAVGGKDSTVTLEIIQASDYDTTSGRFKTLTPFPYNSSSYSCAHPAISPDGKLLAFSSDKPRGEGGRDIYVCRRVGTNSWDAPVNAGKTINTEGEEVFPWWADSTTLYFSSDGHVGLGGLDIYKASYDRETGTFGTPVTMPLPLNSSYDDMTLSLPSEGSGYFSSDRPAPKAGDNIYFYRHMNVYLAVSVTDSLTGKSITANIDLTSVKDSSSGQVPQDKLYTKHLWPNERYQVNVSKAGYWPYPFTVSAVTNGKNLRDTIFKRIRLTPKINTWDSTFAVTVSESPRLPIRPGIMDTPGINVFEVNKVYVIGYFDFNFNKFFYQANKSDVNFEKKVVLDTLYNILMRHPTMVIQVQAHSDCRGTEEYNMKLSIDRAYSVVAYLKKRGIPKERLQYKGFGETAPTVPCPDCYSCTEEEHAQNRVLEFVVLKI